MKYIDWLQTQPCCVPDKSKCQGDVVGAHQRCLGGGGMALKPPDEDALPLCWSCHDLEHRGATTFWGQGTKAATKIYVQQLCDNHLKKYKEEKPWTGQNKSRRR